MRHYAVTALGADQPGIVAALTGELFRQGGNLEDVSSTVLRGQFVVMLVVSMPPNVDAESFEGSLAGAVQPLGVTVTVRQVRGDAPTRVASTHVVVAYGSDKPGIVAAVTGLMAERGIGITDLSCRLAGEDRGGFYVMVAEVDLPETVDPEDIARELARSADDLGVDLTFRPVEVDRL